VLKIIKNNWILISIIFIGLFLRSFKPLTLFQYSHDQDLAGWVIRDVLFNHHIRLIGQETSSQGIFIGPYFYYLQIPFYLLTKMDPAGALLLPIILGTFAIFSIYFVTKSIFNLKVGLIAAIIYAISSLIIFTDREVVPTMPVMLWTIWFLYATWLILKSKKYGYLIAGILIGFIWSISLQLVILMPIILVAELLSVKKNWKNKAKFLIIGALIAFLLNIPFLAFEFRHGFQQTKSLILSITTNKDYIAGTSFGFFAKLDRTMQLVYKNSTNLFTGNILNINVKLIFWLLLLTFAFLVWKKYIDKKMVLIFFLWLITYILFFTKISLNISEYYLNGMNIIWIFLAAVFSSFILKEIKNGRLIISLGIFLFITVNLYSFFSHPVNESGYIQRKAIISYIKEDARKNGFPCVSLSFITSPGNNLGYRYFTWEAYLKTKPVSNDVPVYSIVFPLSSVDSFNKSFGALGLELPDYKRYNNKTIQKKCSGDDFTITQPLFGFTN